MQRPLRERRRLSLADRINTLLGWLRFIPFFLLQSLLGGIDVARRAFHPRTPLSPTLIRYPLSLSESANHSGIAVYSASSAPSVLILFVP
ncbi:MAG: Na+/H+ antiporter subunit E [Chromatiales bacterium]|nr:Na+/H+ antiporter subunit E [Gammaproteobacteria bacterium]MBW6475985.1 Na+/H+ antiporter subunit E [Chromatiales bacterium]